ncbi:response regulator receiver domain-containing protein [Pontibacter ummariensis]|uniref:Response regulator receiver domain-containing protein n=1 Tax=Pontibacter ummariensis TaxID=1610492 RepID=A0A239GGN6_9BACT|nr:response regulator [Pontibacter ummariensis]PRY11214.1 response regulator receiver domain-containing protein [Pontibacter ummariensis]SNS67224.1 Response regulator receiver domain-containing protein [Pontibacter ummariensis]
MYSFRRVVLIDDDSVNNFVCESMIKSENFAAEVVSFEWAEDALNYLKTSATLPDQFPDLIFLDINMPSMDGWRFIEEFSAMPEKITKDCNLFMLSSAVDRRDVIMAKGHHKVKDFFSKPLSTEILNIIKEEYAF